MKIAFVDEKGKSVELDVILTFYDEKYKKNYAVCTDNKKGKDGRVNSYLYESFESEGKVFVKEIDDKKEFNDIKKETNKLLSRLDKNID